jgi:hypothetical protein
MPHYIFSRAGVRRRGTPIDKTDGRGAFLMSYRHWWLAGWCALLLLAHGSAVAQGSLESIKLEIENYNEFSSGYDRSAHTYRTDWLRKALDADTRSVYAEVCDSLAPGRPRMMSVDPSVPCDEDVTVRYPPAEAAAFVWTLRGVHPILKKVVDLKQYRKDLHPYVPASGCRLLENKNVADVECRIAFQPSTAGSAAIDSIPIYEVRFDVLDRSDQVVLSRSQSVSVPRHAPLIVSIGESLASGEGNPDMPGDAEDVNYQPWNQHDCEDDTTVMIKYNLKPKMRRQPIWFESRDHRSLKSGPALAAKELLAEWPYLVFLSFAKSGAEISTPQVDHDILEQLEQLRQLVGDKRIDALLISAGGNDVGFSTVLRKLGSDFEDADLGDVLATYHGKLRGLGDRYGLINSKIAELGLNIGSILINEYPGSLFTDRNNDPAPGCGVFDTFNTVFTQWGISDADAGAIALMGDLLNDEVARAARLHGWRLVTGIKERFAGHGYCTDDSFWRFAEDSCDMQGDFDGMMHPNDKGTGAYARALVRALRDVLPKSDGGPVVAKARRD